MTKKAGNSVARDVLRRVRAAGWRVQPSRNGWKLYSPNGQDIVTIHGSSSDGRHIRNVLADLRRAGLDLDAPHRDVPADLTKERMVPDA